MRAAATLAGLLLLLPGTGSALEASPEVQACLTSLRDGERARAEAVLGPLEALPFFQADLVVEPEERTVTGRVSLTWTPAAESRSLDLRLTPNAFGASVVRLHVPTVNGEPGTLLPVSDDVVRVEFPRALPKGARARVEVELVARVPRGQAAASVLSSLSLGASGERTDHGAFSAQPDAVSLVGILPRPPLTLPDGSQGAGPSGIGDLALYDAANVLLSVTVPAGLAGGGRRGGPGRDGRAQGRDALSLWHRRCARRGAARDARPPRWPGAKSRASRWRLLSPPSWPVRRNAFWTRPRSSFGPWKDGSARRPTGRCGWWRRPSPAGRAAWSFPGW